MSQSYLGEMNGSIESEAGQSGQNLHLLASCGDICLARIIDWISINYLFETDSHAAQSGPQFTA